MKRYLKTVLFIGFIAVHWNVAGAQTVSSFAKASDGALCQLSDGSQLKLQVCAGNIIRVVHTKETAIPSPQGLIVGQATFTPGTWDATDNGTAIVMTTPKVTATVTKATALVTFANSSGTVVCTETGRTLSPVSKGGQAGYSGTLNFNSPDSEGVYGLGNLSLSSPAWSGISWWEVLPPDKSGQLNIRPFTFDMHQANWYDVIPFFMTTSGYGVLMNFCCHATKSTPLNFSADFLLNNSWDYFFIYGPQFDTIISGYRNVTGPAPMLSKWAFGYWQCKNRYASSSQLNGVIDTFRSKNIPVDCIVQDWEWWTNANNGWGTFVWDSPYADPKTWIDAIHAKNAHLALSIWETFSQSTPNYTSLSSHMLTCSANGGTFLNIFDSTAAKAFWGFMNDACYSNGVDAWWMDATEPECPQLTGINTDLGTIDMYSNAYALASAKNIYEKQRAVSTAKRVVNLTRSFYAGQQRWDHVLER